MKKHNTEHGLPIIHARAAGIDIGSRFHVVAVPTALAEEPVQTFQAFTADLERMAAWLVELGITTVAMESTGVYWIPVYEILETHGLQVILANARDARAVPGRKTDVNDAQWIQRLHACGLLRASFHPEREIAALRSYLRLRERHLDYAAAHIQHMQKALMEMNLQLHHVVSDITEATGMRIIRAIVAGKRDPDILAGFRDVRCHSSIENIRASLVGNDRDEHIFALAQSLDLYDFYHAKVAECDCKLEAAVAALNRPLFAVRAMCRMLLVHPSGFYAWLREPFSQRALEDRRQTDLLKTAWDDSGKAYGYRKLHDDLCDLGEDISPNRAWRLARLAGIRAEIGYKKKPGSYGGSPAVVADNTLNREFDVDAPGQF